MFHDRQALADLIGSRICHDLISPLGAISNGLELMSMSGVAPTPEMELIAESIASANSKIRFFRIAYGRAPHGATLAHGEILSVLGDYFHGGRLRIDWQPTHELQRREVKLAFLALQCLETALPFGGDIQITCDDGRWQLAAHSARLRLVAETWDILRGSEAEQENPAAAVQFLLLAILTEFRKPGLTVEAGETALTIRF
ncbi:MAG: histidine phosphotransferase [Rhodobacteraceae bacterium]|nr:histidine phosphotransferase [Paracoccaceae bacterium]